MKINFKKLYSGHELDRLMAGVVMKLRVVGTGKVYSEPEESGYRIARLDEMDIHGEERPLYFSDDWEDGCMCEESKGQREFQKDKETWGHSRYCLEIVPKYSEKIAEAWKIIEYLRIRGTLCDLPSLHFQISSMKDGRSGHFAMFHGPLKPHLSQPTIWSAEGKTFPLSICEAALKVELTLGDGEGESNE